MRRSFWNRHGLSIAVLACGAVFTLVGLSLQWRAARSADVLLRFLDVGQGDAALLRDRSGRDVLIDGGPDDAVLEGLAETLPWWDRTIETVIVTHLDADHFVGLFAVLRRYEVEELWWTGVAPTTEVARRFAAHVEAKGIAQRFIRAGDAIRFSAGAEFRIIWPAEDMRGRILAKPSSNKDGGGTNDAAVVGLFDCGEDAALFAADISAHVEARLVGSGVPIRTALLKVAHHGSAYSTSEGFLDAVLPRAAIISAGAGNRYGHPAPRVLSALLERGIRVRRTDREGTIRYACADGQLIAQ